MSEKKNVLKGNFKVKKPVEFDPNAKKATESLTDKLKTRALATLGGSLVFMERDKLTWDGEE